jgi:hypothetical protein
MDLFTFMIGLLMTGIANRTARSGGRTKGLLDTSRNGCK